MPGDLNHGNRARSPCPRCFSAHRERHAAACIVTRGDRADFGSTQIVGPKTVAHGREFQAARVVQVTAFGMNQAVAVIQSYRQHPRWKVLGFPPVSRELHTDLWQRAAAPGIARRRIYDTRTALALRAFGVTEFATANVKDFEGFGFVKVWNPIEQTAD